jgi:hypothetical protein
MRKHLLVMIGFLGFSLVATVALFVAIQDFL